MADSLSFLGAAQGSVLGFFFLLRKSVGVSVRFLGAYLLLFSLGLLEPFVTKAFPYGFMKLAVIGFLASTNLLYGPLLFHFVKYLVNHNARISRYDCIHAVPFLVNYACILFVPAEANTEANDLIDFVCFELFVLQILWYNVAAIVHLQRHRNRILEQYSSFDESSFNWLKGMLLVITAVYTASFSITHLVAFGVKSAGTFYLFVQAGIVLSVYALGYKMLLRPGMFAMAPHNSAEPKIVKYMRSGLKESEAEQLAIRLRLCMENDKAFLDPDLSLQTLSDRLRISRNHLTQLLNTSFENTFYEFVNTYRVEEAKQLLREPENNLLTLAAIGEKAGFKSKTAFNTNFKKATGLTPNEWKTRSTAIPENANTQLAVNQR